VLGGCGRLRERWPGARGRGHMERVGRVARATAGAAPARAHVRGGPLPREVVAPSRLVRRGRRGSSSSMAPSTAGCRGSPASLAARLRARARGGRHGPLPTHPRRRARGSRCGRHGEAPSPCPARGAGSSSWRTSSARSRPRRQPPRRERPSPAVPRSRRGRARGAARAPPRPRLGREGSPPARGAARPRRSRRSRAGPPHRALPRDSRRLPRRAPGEFSRAGPVRPYCSSKRRAMISCWISFDPSPIRRRGASR
jgi:hypothetical protein